MLAKVAALAEKPLAARVVARKFSIEAVADTVLASAHRFLVRQAREAAEKKKAEQETEEAKSKQKKAN